MAQDDAKVTLAIEGITVVRPGDTLVVALEQKWLTKEQADQYKATLRARLPGLADVVVLGGVTALATYRPDDERAR